MHPDDKANDGDLIRDYETRLGAAALLATDSEQRLYALHLDELRTLKSLLASDAPADAVSELLRRERRAYGWSYLSGAHGERAERAFYALMAALCGNAAS
jgi:hypothetical protein